MDHPVDLAVEADEQAELGDVLHLAVDDRPHRMVFEELVPRVFAALLDSERNAALVGVDLQHHHLDLLAGRDDLAGMDVLLGPAHLGDVDQPLDAGFELDEGAVVGDVADPAGELDADRVFVLDAVPGIGLELLHAERNALGLRVVADDLHPHGLADAERVARMVDAPPGDIGDMQQPVDPAEVDEGAVIGDVFDDPFEDLAFLEIGEQLVAGLGAGFLEHRPARNHDIAAAPVHLEDLERLRGAHQRRHVAHRADIDLAARQKRNRARKVHGEAALDAAEDGAADPLARVERLLQQGPCLFAARPFARQHRLAVAVLHALQIHVDRVPDLELRLAAGRREFLERDPALGFQPDIDQRRVVLDTDDGSLHHRSFGGLAFGEALFEHVCETLSRDQRGGHVRLVVGDCFVRHRRSCLASVQLLLRPETGAVRKTMRAAGFPGDTTFGSSSAR